MLVALMSGCVHSCHSIDTKVLLVLQHITNFTRSASVAFLCHFQKEYCKVQQKAHRSMSETSMCDWQLTLAFSACADAGGFSPGWYQTWQHYLPGRRSPSHTEGPLRNLTGLRRSYVRLKSSVALGACAGRL